MERAGLIEKVRRGVFKISPSGKEVLASPPSRIDIRFLEQFPGFAEFRNKNSSTEAVPAESGTTTDGGATPEEALEDAYQRLRDELAAEVVSQVRKSHPAFFEQLVVDLMLKMGYGGPTDDAGSVTSYGSDGGIDLNPLECRMSDLEVRHRFAANLAGIQIFDTAAHVAQHIDQPRAGGIEPDILDYDLATRNQQRRDNEEGRR